MRACCASGCVSRVSVNTVHITFTCHICFSFRRWTKWRWKTCNRMFVVLILSRQKGVIGQEGGWRWRPQPRQAFHEECCSGIRKFFQVFSDQIPRFQCAIVIVCSLPLNLNTSNRVIWSTTPCHCTMAWFPHAAAYICVSIYTDSVQDLLQIRPTVIVALSPTFLYPLHLRGKKKVFQTVVLLWGLWITFDLWIPLFKNLYSWIYLKLSLLVKMKTS